MHADKDTQEETNQMGMAIQPDPLRILEELIRYRRRELVEMEHLAETLRYATPSIAGNIRSLIGEGISHRYGGTA